MNLIDKLLDASILYSFDQRGFIRHTRSFHQNLKFTKQKNVLITGGTSGIGKAAALELGESSQVIVTGRNEEKAREFSNENIQFKKLDMMDWDLIESFVEDLPKLSSVVLNAGGMPAEKKLNNHGIESQAASQLFGHYYLLNCLLKKQKLSKGARVVWVSSGGMYLKSLDLKNLGNPSDYDKVAVYANVKRAQVTILDYLAKKNPDIIITGMHPGWVDTPAVREAIPGFYDKMQDHLRLPKEGADTILWILSDQAQLSSGAFYFDRKKVKKHLFFFTKKSDKQLEDLIKMLDSSYLKPFGHE